MESKKWVTTKGIYNSDLRKLDPMPPGPYIVALQFDQDWIGGKDFNEVVEKSRDNTMALMRRPCVMQELPILVWGNVVFYNDDGKARVCLTNYDTTD